MGVRGERTLPEKGRHVLTPLRVQAFRPVGERPREVKAAVLLAAVQAAGPERLICAAVAVGKADAVPFFKIGHAGPGILDGGAVLVPEDGGQRDRDDLLARDLIGMADAAGRYFDQHFIVFRGIQPQFRHPKSLGLVMGAWSKYAD
jgi:hypothetical protein